MKKFTAFTILLFIVLGATAQESVRLSFSASPSINWMTSGQNAISRGKVLTGFDFGLDADFYFDKSEKYALTSGLLISNTGGELDFYTDPFTFAGQSIPRGSSIRYRLQYVEVPLAIKLKTSQFKRWTYWGQFGVSGFINTKARGDSSNGTLDKTDISKEINLFNLCLNVGIGSEFDLGSNNAMTIGLIFKNGFTDVTTDNVYEEKTTLSSLILKLGLVF